MNSLRNGLSTLNRALNHALTQAVYITTPVAVASAFQVSLQDTGLRKIVRGIGVTIAGLNLLFVSGIPKKLKSWYWDKIDTPDRDGNLTLAMRSGVASVGLMTTCYGIYNIAMGILELTTPKSCNERLIEAELKFLSCPEGQKLWNEVKSQGPFMVKCASSEEALTGAFVELKTREIFISETHEAMEKSLLFELNNLNRAEMGSLINRNMCNLETDKYAIAVESFEYQTASETYRISDGCVNKGFWPENLREFQEAFSGKSLKVDWTSFNGYLKTQENTGHTDLIRLKWYKNCDPDGIPGWMLKNMDKWKAILKKQNEL